MESQGGVKDVRPEILVPKQMEEKSSGGLISVPTSQRNECTRFLRQSTLKEIVSTRTYVTKDPTREYIGAELISVTSKDTLDYAVKTLAKHKISAVPVVKISHEPQAPNIFKGFIDLLDVASVLVTASKKAVDKTKPDDLKKTGKEVAAMLAGDIVDYAHKNPSLPLHEDHPVSEALELFEKGVHRAPLFDDRKRLVGLCSQMDVVRTLAQKFEKGFAVGMANRSLQEYGCLEWGPQPTAVISVEPTATVQFAITKMVMSGLRSLAVVDPKNGRLIGCFSLHSISCLFHEYSDQQELFCRLGRTVEETLTQYSGELMMPLFELPTISLGAACKLMTKYHTHHLWIVESLESMLPVACCSLTDILRIVRNFEWPSWVASDLDSNPSVMFE